MSLKNRIYSLRVKLSKWILPSENVCSSDITPIVPEHRSGKIVKIISPVEYDPDKPQAKGGKVVKLMPKQLKKIKEAQDRNEM